MSTNAMATCDFSAIKKTGDDSFVYTKELHLCVGQMKQDLEVAQKQIVDLTGAIQLKDLAIQKADERTQLWRDTTLNLNDRLGKVEELKSGNEKLMFALGIATTIAAGFMTAKLLGK
jgi:hypothetical protein